MTDRRFIACTCSAVYERTVEPLARHGKGAFHCGCGAELGAWNGIAALRYQRIAAPDAAQLSGVRARRIA